MISDYDLEFSQKQAVAASPVASTNYIDLKAAKDVAAGEPVNVWARVGPTAFTLLTSLRIEIQGGTTVDGSGVPTFADAVTIVRSREFLLAELGANSALPMPTLPAGTSKKFLRALYTATGTAPGAGSISCGLTPGTDTKAQNVATKF